LAQLKKLKGTDASWKDDVEPPTEEQEFSDDEQERAVKNKKKRKNKKAGDPPAGNEPSSGTGSSDQYRGRKRTFQGNHFEAPTYNRRQSPSPFVLPDVPGFAPVERGYYTAGHYPPNLEHPRFRQRLPYISPKPQWYAQHGPNDFHEQHSLRPPPPISPSFNPMFSPAPRFPQTNPWRTAQPLASPMRPYVNQRPHYFPAPSIEPTPPGV